MVKETKPRRTRRATAKADELTALRSRRDELDARDVERRQREDAALERFATAAAKVSKVREAAEARAVELERRAAVERQRAETAAAEQDGEQAAALLELHQLGRNAEDLATLTGIPVKKVRAMIKSAKPAVASVAEPKPPVEREPAAPEPVATPAPEVTATP
jgi:DNA-directed RNA polymerase specialized sigma24 family protein